MRRLAVAFIFLFLLAYPEILLASCLPNCEPNPNGTGYSSIALARPLHYNARKFFDPEDPVNPTKKGSSGITTGSQSYSYAIPVLSLPGRNGLDVNLTLYYNSRVWTKSSA